VNVAETKKLTNHRASGSDDSTRIPPKLQFSLEEYMEYIDRDECIEVTPESIRLRKIHLDHHERKRQERSLQSK
jgi:GTP-binding protein